MAALRGALLAALTARGSSGEGVKKEPTASGAAGEVEAVHEQTLARVHRQQLVEVQGTSDVLVMGVPYLGPYNVDSSMNPVLATCMGLGYYLAA